jgi:hypothetical protein
MLGLKKKKLLVFTVVAFALVISSSFLSTAHSSQLQLEQGRVLQYKYARMSTYSQAQQTGEALYQVLTFSQEVLSFQIRTEGLFNYTISYQDGFPVYVDRWEALFYLPPECVSQSLQGNLDWVNRLETRVQQNVADKTGQAVNYTVEAGTFQCLNVTVAIAGAWDSGNLTLLYDVNSGILVYEQWIPEVGDVIVQYLASTELVQVSQQGTLFAVFSVVLSSATLATPVALAVHQTRKVIKNRRDSSQIQLANLVKSGFPKKAFVMAVVGALLSLISVLLPWSQTKGSPTYLPLSLPPLLTQSAWVLPSNITFALISIAAYAATILAWLGIAIHLYKTKKLTPQIATLSSSIVAFASAALFVLSGWTYSWGLWVVVAGAVLTIMSLAAANIHITIEVEPEESKEAAEEPEENKP